MKASQWIPLIMFLSFFLPQGADTGSPQETTVAEDEVLRSLFSAYDPETKTIDIDGVSEHLITFDILETTCVDRPLIAVLAATSADPGARLHPFIETEATEEHLGFLRLFILQRKNNHLSSIARHTKEICFSDSSGFRVNEIRLEPELFPVSENECAVGVTIVSTPTIAKGREILSLYAVNGGQLREILETVNGFSDRVYEYESRFSTPGGKTCGRFDILQQWYSKPIVSENPQWQAEPNRNTLYFWNPEHLQYEPHLSRDLKTVGNAHNKDKSSN